MQRTSPWRIVEGRLVRMPSINKELRLILVKLGGGGSSEES